MVSFENIIHSREFSCVYYLKISWSFRGFISGPHRGLTPPWAHTRIDSESVRYLVHIFLSEVHLEEKKEYKNYLRITPTCQERYYTINYKYERHKHTKTKACRKNISCSFIYGFTFLYFCFDAVI